MSVDIKNRRIYLLYIVLAASVALSGSLLLWAVFPSIRDWIKYKKDIKLRYAELQHRYDTTKEIQRLNTEITVIEKAYDDFNNMLFSKDDISRAVKEIADISLDLQIEYISLVPLPETMLGETSFKEKFSLWSCPINIKMKTSFLKLADFIRRIENARKFIKIENVTIKKNPLNSTIHDVDIKVYVFSLLQEKALIK